MRDKLEASSAPPLEARLHLAAGLERRPVDDETAETLLKLIEALEDNDDVQTVSANYEIADDVLTRLTA